jgi:hypothetical protein
MLNADILDIDGASEFVTKIMTEDIAEAKASGDFKKIVLGLIETVGVFLPHGGDAAVEPVRALVGHVLAECPPARAPLTEALQQLDPSLVDKILK